MRRTLRRSSASQFASQSGAQCASVAPPTERNQGLHGLRLNLRRKKFALRAQLSSCKWYPLSCKWWVRPSSAKANTRYSCALVCAVLLIRNSLVSCISMRQTPETRHESAETARRPCTARGRKYGTQLGFIGDAHAETVSRCICDPPRWRAPSAQHVWLSQVEFKSLKQTAVSRNERFRPT